MGKTLDTLIASGSFAREIAKLEEGRSSWRKTVEESSSIAKQFKDALNSTEQYSRLAETLALQTSADTIRKQYRALFDGESEGAKVAKHWQEVQEAQSQSIRKMLEPLDGLRGHFALEEAYRTQIEALTGGSAARELVKTALEQSKITPLAKAWVDQMDASRLQTEKLLEGLSLGSTIRESMKAFEKINKSWAVPKEMLDIVGSLSAVERAIGTVTLPSIDWKSAAALANVLGRDGIEGQLALLGIKQDGSLPVTPSPGAAPSEKGILSRRMQDQMAIVSFILALVAMWVTYAIFEHQERQGAEQQAKNDAQHARELKQLESLSKLIENALAQMTPNQEERFVVRERIATVRSKPADGASIEGRLLPQEVVRAIHRDTKWVEVEYYHWLHEEYRTGWVLKKYLERVPANYSKSSQEQKTDD